MIFYCLPEESDEGSEERSVEEIVGEYSSESVDVLEEAEELLEEIEEMLELCEEHNEDSAEVFEEYDGLVELEELLAQEEGSEGLTKEAVEEAATFESILVSEEWIEESSCLNLEELDEEISIESQEFY